MPPAALPEAGSPLCELIMIGMSLRFSACSARLVATTAAVLVWMLMTWAPLRTSRFTCVVRSLGCTSVNTVSTTSSLSLLSAANFTSPLWMSTYAGAASEEMMPIFSGPVMPFCWRYQR